MNSWKNLGVAIVATLLSVNVQAGNTLHFQAGKINTSGHSLNTAMSPMAQSHQSTDFLVVQFKKPIKQADRQILTQYGADILRYIPDDALLLQSNGVSIAALRSLPGVQAVVEYFSDLKLSKHFGPIDHLTADVEEKVIIRVLTEDALAVIKQHISLNGLGNIQFAKEKAIGVVTTRGQLETLCHIEGVEFVEPYPEFELAEYKLHQDLLMETMAQENDISELNGYESGTKVMKFESAWGNGYTGDGQLVGFADTGLDSGSVDSIHEDFSGQVLKGYAYGFFSFSWNDPMGHGTHVAGSIASSGSASNGMLKGGAYKAKLIAGGMWSQIFDNMIPPSDISVMFKDAYADGARIHTNSWGSPQNPGAYDSFAETVDKFMWENPEMLIMFAAGNSGADADKDGRVDEDSIGSPATAKNVLAVGASENFVTEGGLQRRVGDIKDQQGNLRFPTEPLASDYLSDDADGIAVFSSRGPTDDGRVKPDVVAPGANILSVRSQVKDASELWGAFNQDYTWSGGTSMSTPLVAGAAAVVRQYLDQAKGMSTPSAALVKAVLMHTSKDLYPGQFGAIGKSNGQELLQQRPNIHQGFGLVDMKRATAMDSDILIDNSNGVEQGGTVTHTVNIEDESDLMVTLHYTDAPAAASANKALVNDIDMNIVGGNVASKHEDRVNNFEYALLKNVKGQIDIQVKGFRIPVARSNGALPYAMVITASKVEAQNDDDLNSDDDSDVEDQPEQDDEEQEEERSLADIISDILKQLLGRAFSLG